MARTKHTARKMTGAKQPRKHILTSNPKVKPQLPVESREHTDSDQVPSHSEKSEDSKNLLNSSSENFLSKDSLEKSPTTSRLTLDSNLPPSLPSKRPLKPTWSDFSKTPTFAPSTPRELPSCQKTCNSPEESEERDLELDYFNICDP